MINVKINNIQTPYKLGLNLQEHFNETLDSGLLVIPQVEKMTLEPMDEVVFSGDISKYMLVSKYKGLL